MSAAGPSGPVEGLLASARCLLLWAEIVRACLGIQTICILIYEQSGAIVMVKGDMDSLFYGGAWDSTAQLLYGWHSCNGSTRGG